jgi:hypothetical protein
MSGRSGTLEEARTALKRGYTVVATRFPCDIDTADIALSQARGILDVLTVACQGLDIEGTYGGSLTQSLYAALGEIDRARTALFGREVGHG